MQPGGFTDDSLALVRTSMSRWAGLCKAFGFEGFRFRVSRFRIRI